MHSCVWDNLSLICESETVLIICVFYFRCLFLRYSFDLFWYIVKVQMQLRVLYWSKRLQTECSLFLFFYAVNEYKNKKSKILRACF